MTQVTIPTAIGGDGLPFSDDGTSARDMQGQGYASHFFPMVAQAVAAVQVGVQAAGAIATASTNTASSTSLTIGTGAKALTVETGKALVPGMWVLLAYSADPAKNMIGQVTSYNAGTGALVLNVTATSGAGTYADWAGSVTGAPAAVPSIARADKTSAYTLVGTDKGAIIDCSGTWTLDLTAAATLGAGWWCYVRNVGTGTITADPNASELIDGVTSGAIRPGMTLLIQCDGTAFHCVRVGPHVAMAVLTSGTSWTCPLGVRTVRLRQSGGGAGGAAAAGGSAGSCGGYLEAVWVSVPGSSYSYSIGVAGTAGNAGGTTTFTANGITYSSTGGGATPTFGQSVPGTSSNGVINSKGATGDVAQVGTPVFDGAASPIGYGSGGKTNLPGTQGAIILEY